MAKFDDVRMLARERFEAINRGELVIAEHLRPCRLKILMVVDGNPGQFLNVSFSDSYFGLATVLDSLRNNPEWWVRFDVTRAHRQVDDFKPNPATEPELHARYGPHFENFRFTQRGFDINAFDQVWFFGARGNVNDPQRLSDAELEILARWMDTRKGGVFATGDHADLGASLCARIPRVRSMRRWTNTAATNVVPMPIPPGSGPTRHDTLVKGDNSSYTFDDESDIHPMPLTLRRYPLTSWSPMFLRHRPHRVMCGSAGAIDVFPDHPHEGWVNDDADINPALTFTFGTYANKPEYPTAAGHQEKAELIAEAHVLGDHTASSDSNKGLANAKRFGVVGAYNGHRSGVGRVVVDSTWHHWFDVNLSGRPGLPSSNPKSQGFFFNAAGEATLARIQNYFRNVGFWLASPNVQRCMMTRATWTTVVRYPLAEQLELNTPIWELGRFTQNALARLGGPCAMTDWLLDLFPIKLVERFIPRPDPCLSCPSIEAIEVFALGGVVREMLSLAYEAREGKDKIDTKHLAQAMSKGMQAGLSEFITLHKQSWQQAEQRIKPLAAALAELPKAADFMHKVEAAPPIARAKRRKA